MATYQCKCFKCQKFYTSPFMEDLDGDGKCPPCRILVKRIADQVDADMKRQRAGRVEQPRVLPQDGYINARQLMK